MATSSIFETPTFTKRSSVESLLDAIEDSRKGSSSCKSANNAVRIRESLSQAELKSIIANN